MSRRQIFCAFPYAPCRRDRALPQVVSLKAWTTEGSGSARVARVLLRGRCVGQNFGDAKKPGSFGFTHLQPTSEHGLRLRPERRIRRDASWQIRLLGIFCRGEVPHGWGSLSSSEAAGRALA